MIEHLVVRTFRGRMGVSAATLALIAAAALPGTAAFGLAAGGTEPAAIPFQANPLESFTNDLGSISFTRDAATAGTGTSTSNPRQHVKHAELVHRRVQRLRRHGGSSRVAAPRTGRRQHGQQTAPSCGWTPTTTCRGPRCSGMRPPPLPWRRTASS